MITFTGTQMYPGCGKAPVPRDIAVGMCRITRYAGSLWCPLAAHSILVADFAYLDSDNDDVMWAYGLLHDAHETITGELVRAYKPKAMKEFETELDIEIFKAFNLDYDKYQEVRAAIKVADEKALAAECTILELKGWPEYYLKMNGEKPPVLTPFELHLAELTLMGGWRSGAMVEEGAPQQERLTMVLANILFGKLQEARLKGSSIGFAQDWAPGSGIQGCPEKSEGTDR